MNLKLCFKKLFTKPKKFIGEITFSVDFRNLPKAEFDKKFIILKAERYQRKTFFREDAVSIVYDGLHLGCWKEVGVSKDWQGEYEHDYIAGCVTTWNKVSPKFTQVDGTWIVKAKFPKSWACLWLLHPDYFVSSINKEHIIPEIDFAECNEGKIENVVHYGYSFVKYSTRGKLGFMMKPDGKFHEYAVEMKPNGYNFYLDGYLMNSFISDDPEFVAEQPKYLIINNAPTKGDVNFKESDFIIESIKVLK